MQRYKLYYWLENYNSILPANLPAEDYVVAISALIDDFLKFNYGNREMIFDSLEYLDGETDANILAWIKQKIYLLFQAKNESYKRIYQGLTEEYNPLWNVDGTETETHSGNDVTTHSGSDIETHSGSDIETHSGSDTVSNSGTDSTTEAHSGTDTRTIANTGTDTNTETNSGTDTVNENVATFDNPAMIPQKQTQTVNGKQTINAMQRNTTTTDGLAHGESVNGSITHGLETETEYGHVRTFANGHAITYANGHAITVANGHKIVTERHGNIGVTKSTELLRDHLDLWQGLSFLDIIAKDIINTICYSVI